MEVPSKGEERIEQRTKSVAVGLSSSEARKKREEVNVRVRKQKRNEEVKKRRPHPKPDLPAPLPGTTPTKDSRGLSGHLCSDDPTVILHAVTQFRKMLSIEVNPPIRIIIEIGVVPKIVEALRRDDYPPLQLEAAWALTNIASGTSSECQYIINLGVIPLFVQLLDSPTPEVAEQVACGLANIAGDSADNRDDILNLGALPKLLRLAQTNSIEIKRVSTWTISNLCRGKPQPKFEQISFAIPVLADLLLSDDTEVLGNVCWAFSHLCDGPDMIQFISKANVIPRIVELTTHSGSAVQQHSLHVIRNILSTGTDEQFSYLFSFPSFLQILTQLVETSQREIKKEFCWIITTIIERKNQFIDFLIEQKIIIKGLFNFISNAENDVQIEVLVTFLAILKSENSSHISYLINEGCVPLICRLLNDTDPRVINDSLDCIDHILMLGSVTQVHNNENQNHFHLLFESVGGIESLEKLQTHANSEVSQKSQQIFEKYFGNQQLLVIDETIAPTVNSSGQFQFGTGFL